MTETVFKTDSLIAEMNEVFNRHISGQINKFSDFKKNMDHILQMPYVVNLESKNKNLIAFCKKLKERVDLLQKKMDEYENFGNIKLEIKEIDKHTPAWDFENELADLINQNSQGEDSNPEEGGGDESSEESETDLDLLEMGIAADDPVINEWKKEVQDLNEKNTMKLITLKSGETDDTFYTNDKLSGKIYENCDGTVGNEIGYLEDGLPFFSE